MDEIKLEALRLAVSSGQPIDMVIERAKAYEEFLRDVPSHLRLDKHLMAKQQMLSKGLG